MAADPGELRSLSNREPQTVDILHASSVSYRGRALLIMGASGTGKSALALELMSRGAQLISDDQTLLHATPEGLMADAPDTIKGRIEARGIGILNATPAGPKPLALAVDLDRDETARLPEFYTFTRLGVTIPLLYRVPYPHFIPALLQFLTAGRIPI